MAGLITIGCTFLDTGTGIYDRKIFIEARQDAKDQSILLKNTLRRLEDENQQRLDPRDPIPRFSSEIDTDISKNLENWGTQGPCEFASITVAGLSIAIQALNLFTIAAYETNYLGQDTTDILGKAALCANTGTFILTSFFKYVSKKNQDSQRKMSETNQTNLETLIIQTKNAYSHI